MIYAEYVEFDMPTGERMRRLEAYNSAVSAAQQRRANSTNKWGTVMTVAANALPYILGLFL